MEAHNCYILPQSLPQFCPWRTLPPPTIFASPSQIHHPKSIFHHPISCSTKSRNWDSNAESLRSRKFNSKFRSKDEIKKEEAAEAEDYAKNRRWLSDELPTMEERTSGGFWDEVTEYRLWNFEIFKSYSWTLPFILLSGLLANDPNAFLIALALPLGQSALSLTFEKLWGMPESKPKRKAKMRRKPFVHTAGTTVTEEEELEENQKTRKVKTGYQSWVVQNDGSLNRGGQDACNFGGWDDLKGYGPAMRPSQQMDLSQGMTMEEVKLSRKVRKNDTPLLLRLLIAIFLFLGTWTKIL